jgi:hypothetical protein
MRNSGVHEASSREPDERRSVIHPELAQLRDRTDEIELIISGLTTVTLFTLPGWLFERFAETYTHHSLTTMASGSAAIILLTGLSYGLGACFLVHLMARAYWVGLIGLRTVFPHGIDWNRTAGIGPLTRERYRDRLPDLKTAIERSDRVASSLFAVISVIAIGIFWIALILTLAATIGGLVGARFGAPNAGITYASLGIVALAAGSSALLWLLDAVLAARVPALQRAGWFRWLVAAIGRIQGWLFPQRLVLPVQLTLQSNTRPVFFLVLTTLAVIAVVVLGQFSYSRTTNFTISSEFRYLGDEQLQGPAFHSGYYEDMLESRDRLRARPMIPTFEQRGSHVRLFLPYQPIRDNLLLNQMCPGDEATLGAGCLQRLWSVSLNGADIDVRGFLASQRLDLGMRGLMGVVPLEGISPGLHVLSVIWNPTADAATVPLDDRYTTARFEYHIPFLFAPDFERQLDEATKPID